MSEIDLAVFDLAGITTTKVSDQATAALIATLSTLGLPIQPAEIEAAGGPSKRETIEQLLLRYSPEQATTATIDRLFAAFNKKLGEMERAQTVRGIDGAEVVLRWIRARGIKVAVTTALNRKAANQLLATLKWNLEVVDAVVTTEDVRRWRPAPYLIFRAMELTGATNVKRVAVLGDTALDLEAGANASVGMNIAVLTGAEPREGLEQAPHTHVIESIRKFPPLLGGAAAAEEPPKPPEAPKQPEAPKPPEPPLGQGFVSGSNLPS